MAIQGISLHDEAFLELHNGTIDWASGEVAAVLCADGYVPDTAHNNYEDLTHELDPAGDYAPQSVSGRSIARSGDKIIYDCDEIVFGQDVTLSARYLLFVRGAAAGLEATDRVIGVVDFGGTKSSVAGTDHSRFAFTPAATGVWNTDRGGV